jgi:hypothetical protein
MELQDPQVPPAQELLARPVLLVLTVLQDQPVSQVLQAPQARLVQESLVLPVLTALMESPVL